MNKIKIAGMFAAVATFAFPAITSAAVTNPFLTFNGENTATAAAGDTVDANVQVNLTGNSTIDAFWEEIPGSGFPGRCIDVSDQKQAGPHSIDTTIYTNGTTEGTYEVDLTPYGTPAGNADNNCVNSIPLVTVMHGPTLRFPAKLTITQNQNSGTTVNNTGGGNTSSNSSSGSSALNSISAQISALTASVQAFIAAQLHPTTTPPTVLPVNEAKCDSARPFLGAQPYAYSSVGVQLQSVLLLNDPTSIPALHAGATIPMGFFGKQTHQALTNFSNEYSCGFIFN